MSRKLVTYNRTMHDALIVSEKTDGGRAGDPPEETDLQIVDNMDTELTTIPLPQEPLLPAWII